MKIAIARGEEEVAREALERLELIESPSFFNHRKSTVEFAFKNIPEALVAARAAVDSEPNPTFAMLTQLAKCQITMRYLDDAKRTMEHLRKRYGRINRDIHTGLNIRYTLADGRVEDALTLWKEVEDKSRPVHKLLRRDMLEMALSGEEYGSAERAEYKAELESLKSELASFKETHLQVMEVVDRYSDNISSR